MKEVNLFLESNFSMWIINTYHTILPILEVCPTLIFKFFDSTISFSLIICQLNTNVIMAAVFVLIGRKKSQHEERESLAAFENLTACQLNSKCFVISIEIECADVC